MNKKTHTITAYKLDFKKYRGRDLFDLKSNGFEFGELFKSFINSISNKTYMGKNSQRAMKITNYSENNIDDKCNRYNLMVKSGKYGEQIELVNVENDDVKIYDEKYVGLYGHNVFCYEYEDEVIILFHRVSNSGCKTVFMEAFNDYLKEIHNFYSVFTGCFCPSSVKIDISSILPKKVTLTTYVESESSDISENKKIKKRKKDVTLYLDSQDNLKATIGGYLSRKLSKEELKLALLDFDNSFDTASLTISIGNSTSRTVDCEDFLEKIIDYDISSQVLSNDGKNIFYVDKLFSVCNDYVEKVYCELIKNRKEN